MRAAAFHGNTSPFLFYLQLMYLKSLLFRFSHHENSWSGAIHLVGVAKFPVRNIFLPFFLIKISTHKKLVSNLYPSEY